MTYDASVQKDGDDSTTSGGSRPFWGRVVNWRPYQGLVAIVTVSPRRQFFILVAFPVLWLLTQHLGPMLQMLHVSLLDAYPVAPGTAHTFTFDNYMRFLGDRIFWQPFFRTLTFAAVFYFLHTDHHVSCCLFSCPTREPQESNAYAVAFVNPILGGRNRAHICDYDPVR